MSSSSSMSNSTSSTESLRKRAKLEPPSTSQTVTNTSPKTEGKSASTLEVKGIEQASVEEHDIAGFSLRDIRILVSLWSQTVYWMSDVNRSS